MAGKWMTSGEFVRSGQVPFVGSLGAVGGEGRGGGGGGSVGAHEGWWWEEDKAMASATMECLRGVSQVSCFVGGSRNGNFGPAIPACPSANNGLCSISPTYSVFFCSHSSLVAIQYPIALDSCRPRPRSSEDLVTPFTAPMDLPPPPVPFRQCTRCHFLTSITPP